MEINRTLLPDLRAHLSQKEITLLIGPRQAGKTTLLLELAGQLTASGESCHFFNLDIDIDAQFFNSQQQFVDRVQALTGGQRSHIFIDEVQRIENAGLFLKGIYDRRLPHKWIATGSGSLELKEKIAESLSGRKRVFILNPVSIIEFLAYRMSGNDVSRLASLLKTDPVSEEKFLLEYLQFGGYPKVITSIAVEEKNRALSEIFQSYIERDIQNLLKLEKSKSLVVLLQLLSNRIGKLINYQDLANLTNLSVATVKNYLWYCEKTFVIEEVLPFFTNREKELVKSPQYYFTDCGLRNYLLGVQNLTPFSPDFGFLFQQLIFQLLKNRYLDSVASIRYWRTQNQAEVDFVVQSGMQLLPVEVKAAKLNQPRIEKSMHSFINIYQPAEAWIINRSLSDSIKIGNTEVRFLPWHHLLK
jgi:uncharacterized protein